MVVKSQAVLPYLVPKLTQHPVNTKALSLLASVAGPALDRELYKILQVLHTCLIRAPHQIKPHSTNGRLKSRQYTIPGRL